MLVVVPEITSVQISMRILTPLKVRSAWLQVAQRTWRQDAFILFSGSEIGRAPATLEKTHNESPERFPEVKPFEPYCLQHAALS